MKFNDWTRITTDLFTKELVNNTGSVGFIKRPDGKYNVWFIGSLPIYHSGFYAGYTCHVDDVTKSIDDIKKYVDEYLERIEGSFTIFA